MTTVEILWSGTLNPAVDQSVNRGRNSNREFDSFSSPLSISVPLLNGAVHCVLLSTFFPSRSCRRGLAGLGVGLVLLGGGCRKPLLTADEERSQFQRYDRVRELDQPSYYMDEFGRRRPNLRGRLQPVE